MVIDGPWMIVGDFDFVLNSDERSSEGWASSCFANWVTRRGLIDMGYLGCRFTWHHGGSLETRRSARLDKGLCTDD